MLFTSAEFILVFLPLVFLVYFWLNHRRQTQAGKSWLVLASLFFYGWWNPAYVPLILLSMGINFGVGAVLSAAAPAGRQRVPVLLAGIVFNLGLLAYFKYAGFLVANIDRLFGAAIPVPEIALPLAISFFSFTQIAYLVDCHRGEVKDRDPLNYALFVSFFPHLIAGPIVHHRAIMSQFASARNLVRHYPNIVLGLFIFTLGLFKKVVVADSFALWATTGFDQAPALNFFEAWFTSLAYTFQIYFDFSGYTDMAIGASLLFNIRLPINFNSPYKAVDIRDFWRRWHITLSQFLRDYLYVPLGGNRARPARIYTNLFVTFALGGLWHGASWMFVIWGASHGAAIVLHRLWRQWGRKSGRRMPALLAWFITFNFVNLTWVFFRAKGWDDAMKVMKGMAGLNGVILPQAARDGLGFLQGWGIHFGAWIERIGGDATTVPWLAAALILALAFRNSNELFFAPDSKRFIGPGWATAIAVIASVSILLSWASTYTEFIYFNF